MFGLFKRNKGRKSDFDSAHQGSDFPEDNTTKVDLSIRRRKYQTDELQVETCPECGAPLIINDVTIAVAVNNNGELEQFLTNVSGSSFCEKCPVVVFRNSYIKTGIQQILNEKEFQFKILGIVDFDAVPEENQKYEFGSDKNPIPLVKFLPDQKTNSQNKEKSIGRNDLCHCGSGKKYKKCCGNTVSKI